MKKLLMLSLLVIGVGFAPKLNAQTGCDESCIEWWLVITDNYGRVLEEHYLYTTCNGEETVSACEESTSRGNYYLFEDEASCEEVWGLSVVMSHENNDMCGAYVKAKGRLTSRGGGSWSAETYLDKYHGAMLFSGICETAFYSVVDRSFVSTANQPNVSANFIADVGIGINLTISGGQIVEGDGWLWFPAGPPINQFKSTQFNNPLCW